MLTVAAAPGSAQDAAVDQAAIEEDLQEIRDILGQDAPEGEDSDELKDFVPSEPLSADIAIEFPSDI